MNELKVFENSEFGAIRTLEENGTVLFSGSDVAKALGYNRPRDAVSRHCHHAVKHGGVSSTTNQYGVTTEQTVEMSFIPEGDVYRLIIRSKLPAAEKFERWVFDEVLPSLRKHGLYAADELLDNPDLMIQAMQALKAERAKNKELADKVQKDAPKVLFADSVTASHTSILVYDLAKLLRQNGVSIGGNRLFGWLREHGYLVRRNGMDYNMPTQKSMELGLFEVKETAITHSDGHTSVNKTPKVTGKGQVYFVNKFLKKKEEE